MTQPKRKRAPGGGRKRTGKVRRTVTLPVVLWQFVDVIPGANRSEKLQVALEFAAEKWGYEPLNEVQIEITDVQVMPVQGRWSGKTHTRPDFPVDPADYE